jgi:diguanylate cyclase (GGDEF)-like protein/PAS domain S-box-containing protein
MVSPVPSSSSQTGEKDWFRILAETTSTAIFVYRDRLAYVNSAAEQLSGYTTDELLSMRFRDLVHPDSLELSEESTLAGNRAQTGSERLELKIVRKDGDERWIDLTTTTIDLHGEPTILASAFDITDHKQSELALRESQERLNLAHRAARSVSWEWCPETDRLTVSELADQLFGLPLHKIVRTGEDFVNLVHPEDRDRLGRALGRLVRDDRDLSLEVRVISPRGEIRWLAEKALAVRSSTGWVDRVIGVAHDITERKITEEALFQEKERAHVTLASIADGVIRTDPNGAIDYLNPVAQRLTGWTLAEAYGRPSSDIYHVVDEDTGKRVLDPVGHCLKDRREVVFLGGRRVIHRDGTEFPIHDSAAPIRNREGRVIGAILVFKDLSHVRQVEEEMIHLASHDPLTGWMNRRAFEAALGVTLEEAGKRARKHALCHLDLDNFKLVNDTSGHEAGDQLIRQVALIIHNKVRRRDVLARFSGDEFVILFRDCSSDEARRLAQEILEALRAFRFRWQDRLFSSRVSIGLAPFTTGSFEPGAVLSWADAACYVAKESGGDRIHVYRPGDTAVAERRGELQWISRINQAVEDDRLCLYHQTIQPLNGDPAEPPLAELFVRLIDDDGDVVAPGAFVAAAERYGLVSTIDEWVLRRALQIIADGEHTTDETRFAINVSGQSLGVDGFLGQVVNEFETSGVAPGRVLFEITETAAIGNLRNALRFISVLKEMGCRFVLDDFGRGLSSFGYLQNLPVDYLKIDGEFVRRMLTDPIQAALVALIHEIGDVMGLRTIAESVEDEETLEALTRIGIDYAQGFFIARPEPLSPQPTGRSPLF